ncbi:Pka-R2 [Bugula neritina]|uniref:Pka-R2 n=1 Tax=Bugula neritina TaxID=10212 RepID=A0A7J7J6N1_BUGNE|nr:Pka-R2 [Bugula neritina]
MQPFYIYEQVILFPVQVFEYQICGVVWLEWLELSYYASAVFLAVEAFERLLGPCMDIMRRNMVAYDEDMIRAFGGKDKISDLR